MKNFMLKRVIVFPIVVLLLSMISVPQSITAASGITTYVVPAITDNKILPTSSISANYISNMINVAGCDDEYISASFAVKAQQNITGLIVSPSNLVSGNNVIAAGNIDISVVKCWYQGNYLKSVADSPDYRSVIGKFLTPELLLKDDTLIKVTGEDWGQWNVSNPNGINYIKLTDGSYIDITNGQVANRSIMDTSTLQPVNISSGYNKQFWITLHVPANAIAGNYAGQINLQTSTGVIGTYTLNLTVYPFQLAKSYMTHGLYYKGFINGSGSISSEGKSTAQYSAEMLDMSKHGITNVVVSDPYSSSGLSSELNIMHSVGIGADGKFYCWGIDPNNYGGDTAFKNLLTSKGVTDIYLYGADEQSASQNSPIASSFHSKGYKFMVASYTVSDMSSMASFCDLLVASSGQWGLDNTALANSYHNYGHKIVSYNNPQAVPEAPATFRNNYGLKLWQWNYDGAMDFAYQQSYGDIWNDFDSSESRDHAFAYPTTSGVVDTIQWEGYLQGINDVRYLTTLLNTIQTAKNAGKNTSNAESWLATLKTSNLDSQNLDSIRSQMANYIISLSGTASSTPNPITTTPPPSTPAPAPAPTPTPTPTPNLTFGYASGIAVWTEAPNRIDFARLQNTAGTGVLTGIELKFNQTTAQGKVRLGVYADNNGTVGNLMLDAGEVPAGTSWVGIYGLNLPVTGNSYYWLALSLSASNTIEYTTGGTHKADQNAPYGQLKTTPNITMTNTTPYIMRAIVKVGAILTPTPIPPSVTSTVATGVSTSSTTFNGNLNNLGSSNNVQVSFDYGTTTGYGSTTTAQTKSTTGAFSTGVAGLNPGTIYHYRAKVKGASTVYGNDITFTTLAPTPTINHPPTLNTIGNKTITIWSQLSFTISASDPDGGLLTYSASNLPAGASFNPTTHTFSWRPSYWQTGVYSNIHFQVSDGSLTASQNIVITVNNLPTWYWWYFKPLN